MNNNITYNTNTTECINCCQLKKELRAVQLLVRQYKGHSFDVAQNCFQQMINNQTNCRAHCYLSGAIRNEEETNQELQIYETYEKLEGVVDLGKEYEYLTSSLCALKFCQSDEIKNFRMTTNNKKWDKFDDLELDAESTDGTKIRFLFQLKLTLNDKEPLSLDMSTPENTFRKKNKIYLMNFLNLVDNFLKSNKSKESTTTVYVLYSNFPTTLKDRAKLSFKKNAISLIAKKVQIPFQELLLASPDQQIFQFEPEHQQNSSFEEACKSFYLVCGQPNVESVKIKIKTMLRDLFRSYIYEYYEQFMRSWWLDNFVLTKNDLVVKLVDFILSPYIKTLSGKKSNYKSNILEAAILNFDMTLLENDKEGIMCNIWPQIVTEDDLRAIPPIFELSSKNLTPLQRTKVLWYLGKAPLVINAEEIESAALESVLELMRKCLKIKKVVLLGKFQKTKFTQWKKFNLSELKFRNSTMFSKMLKELKVSIQGRKQLSLENLITIDETFLEIFSIKELLLMTQNEYLQIGYQNDVLSLYVSRRLSTGVVKVKEIGKIFDQSDIVIISCNKTLLKSLYQNQNIIFIDSTSVCIKSVFNKECKKNKHANVYGLQQIDEEFCVLILWNNNKSQMRLSEKELQDTEIVKNLECSSLNVICGPAGIGKSQLMKNLSKNTNPDSWTVSISLILFNTFLSTNPNYETMKTKLLNLDNQDVLVSKTRNLLLKNGKLCLFLDGLDEVTSKYLYLVLDFIRRITKDGVKVWASSRDHLKEVISISLGAVFVTIQPFNDREEILYIRKKLKNHYNDEELDHIQKILTENMHLANCREVLGSPLLLHIITEVFLNSKKAYENIQQQDVLALTKMFKLFFLGKIRTAFEKLDIDESEAPQLGVGEDEDYLENYEVAALKTCLEETDFRKLNIDSSAVNRLLARIRMEGDKFGIIKEIVHDEANDNFVFCHKTYAEYFASVWFKKNPKNFSIIGNEMFSPKYEGLRRMFDILVAENNPLHLAIIYKNPEQFRKHLKTGFEKDEGGRTAAHLAFSYGEKYFQIGDKSECKDESESYKMILESLFEKKINLHCQDKLLEATPLEYALMTHCLYPLEKSVERRIFLTNEIVNNLCLIFDVQVLIKFVLQMGYHNLLAQFLLLEPSLLTEFQGNSLLHFAALKEDNVKIITLLIEKGFQVDIKNDKGQTALYLATERKLIKNIETLLKKRASPTLQDDNGDCPLFLACSKEPNASIIKMFANSINFTDEATGNTALLVACEKGCIENVQTLLEMGASLNTLNLNNENALHFASCSAFENTEVIEFLISKGLDVNAKNRFGFVCLQLACKNGCVENVKLLMEKGADFNVATIYDENLLHLASSSKKENSEVIDFLIGNGLDVNAKTSIGLTPLLLAVQKGIVGNLKKLIERGADKNALDQCKGSALHRACSSEKANSEVINLLIACGLDVNAKDENGDIPLFEACCKASIEKVVTLIENEASLFELNNKKENALHFASRSEKTNVDVINLLINLHLNVNCKESKGNTPLLLACSKGCLENVEMLISRGADVNALNTNGDNALHRASWCDHDNTEVIKLLLTHGLNPDVRNLTGQSAIDVATRFRYSEEKIAALNQNRSLLKKLWF